MVYPVEFRTARLRVREFAPDDFEAFFAIVSDPVVVRYLAFGPTTDEEARGLIDFAVGSAKAAPRSQYALAVVERESGVVVGSCGLDGQADEPGMSELYLAFRRASWGAGYGAEVLRALIEFAFEDLSQHRLFGDVHPENIASGRTMERAGLSWERTIGRAFEKDGRWHDAARYAILRPVGGE